MFASSPEELETLLEDAVLLGDEGAVASLFDQGAVLVAGPLVTGPERALAELTKLGYVATTRTVTVQHDTAVVVGDQTVNVSVRTPHGAWRLVATIVRPGNVKRRDLTELTRNLSRGRGESVSPVAAKQSTRSKGRRQPN